jgi:hypothetical protein
MKLFIDSRNTLEECKRLLKRIKSDNINELAEAKLAINKIDSLLTRLNRAIDN